MERKRKLPARAARVEGVSKKRTSTPPEHRIQTPTPPLPPPVVEESLPRSILPGKPLPTVDKPQSEHLSSKEFQTVSESGVLAESLKRSRQTWISEGIFERYWTKVTKKKGASELLNNPGKDTMTKLGTCTITCEPHILDAVMYAIKEPNRPAIPAVAQQQQMQRPIIQYGPPNGMMPPPPPPPAPKPVQQKPHPPPIPQPSPNSQDTPMTNSANPPPTTSRPSSMNGTVTNGQSSHPSPNASHAPPPANKSTDPVIQMLAERAATDPDLKALMRIVANGEASSDELKKFQGHIDDLTRLQRARQAAAQAQQPPHPGNHGPPPPAPSTPQMNSAARPGQSLAPLARAPPTPTPAPLPTPPQYLPQPQALRSKGPVPATKPDISGVVFEFTGGSGDRFSFPKFSILEYLPGGQVIASFLIVRKGSSSDSPSYDPTLDYYQPITIRLYAHQGRQLDALQKVVAPADEVRRYMDDIMDNTTRAEYVLLAMRLPREIKEAAPPAEKVGEAARPPPMENQVLWATTTPTASVHIPYPVARTGERLLTEEEKYQSFIATVS